MSEQTLHPTKKILSLRKGTIMKGNDGNLWKVTINEKNKQWKKFTNYQLINGTSIDNIRSTKEYTTKSYISYDKITPQKYKVYDNSGIPFLVVIDYNAINIFAYYENLLENDENSDSNDDNNFTINILTIVNFLGYWNSYNPNDHTRCTPGWFIGDSILVQLNSYNYIFIGGKIYMFSTNDIIYDYCTEKGSKGFNCTVAFGDNDTYYMLECNCFPSNKIPNVIALRNLNSYCGHIKAFDDYMHLNNNKIVPHDILEIKILLDRRW